MTKPFRKIALERLSSPEQLDQLMQVTDPRGWLALAAMIVLIGAVVVWGFVGSIPTEAPGEGILIRRGGVSDLVATGTGQVEQVLPSVGDQLERGQVVATIRQDQLLRQIEDVESTLREAENEYRELQRFAEEQRRLSARNLAQESTNLERTIATLERNVELLAERVDAQRELLADGLITQQTYLTTEQEHNTTRDQLAAKRLELSSLELRRLEEQQELDQQLETRRGQLRERELELRELRASLEENVRVVAPDAGRVLELSVARGDLVNPGDRLLTMEVVSEELLAVIFVPAELGKQVRPGMPARVSPSNVKREEHGFMLGEVTWVAEFPATSSGMRRLLANEELVERMMSEGPPIRVDVALRRDPATPSGFAWSSARGPDLEITSGTLTEARVILREEPPIALAFPRLRPALED